MLPHQLPPRMPDYSVRPGFRVLGALLTLAFTVFSFVKAYDVLTLTKFSLPPCVDPSNRSRLLCELGTAMIAGLPPFGQKLMLAATEASIGVLGFVLFWWLIKPFTGQQADAGKQ